MMDERHITVVDDEGNEQLCEVLFTFESEQFKKWYVLYYPISADEDEEIEIQASSFIDEGNGENGELLPIETEEEWDMVEEMLAAFLEEDEEDEEEDEE